MPCQVPAILLGLVAMWGAWESLQIFVAPCQALRLGSLLPSKDFILMCQDNSGVLSLRALSLNVRHPQVSLA